MMFTIDILWLLNVMIPGRLHCDILCLNMNLKKDFPHFSVCSVFCVQACGAKC